MCKYGHCTLRQLVNETHRLKRLFPSLLKTPKYIRNITIAYHQSTRESIDDHWDLGSQQ